jgi:hypothetical protein
MQNLLSFIAEHLPSFSLGAAAGLFAAFFSGILRSAGADFYGLLKGKFFPPPPKSVEVDKAYEPDIQYFGSCAWVGEDKLVKYLDNGYTYYKYPKTGGSCFRYSSAARNHKEYLMHQPTVA